MNLHRHLLTLAHHRLMSPSTTTRFGKGESSKKKDLGKDEMAREIESGEDEYDTSVFMVGAHASGSHLLGHVCARGRHA